MKTLTVTTATLVVALIVALYVSAITPAGATNNQPTRPFGMGQACEALGCVKVAQ